MGVEIERKYLVTSDEYIAMSTRVIEIRQGYLSLEPSRTVRVRLADAAGEVRAYITIKGVTQGSRRDEFEYEIPYSDALQIYAMCVARIHKHRYIVLWQGQKWEVDRFEDAHEGLVLAEVELQSEDAEVLKPPFIGIEVTDNPRYYNSVLATENITNNKLKNSNNQ